MSKPTLFPDDDNYVALLEGLKRRIRTAQVKASLAVNQELILLYWHIGREILTRQQAEGWGTKVIERLAKDLKREFATMKGLSRSNLLYMRAFAEAWPDEEFVQQLVGQIPWGHNIQLLDKVKNREERQWYIQQTIANGWSRNVLILQIESGLYKRQGDAITNFDRALPSPQSDLVQGLVKDPYNLSFLDIDGTASERSLEEALVERMKDFLLELGVGFSFMGSQYRLEVEGDDYFLDLLFYHVQLRCYVVIDLKVTEFRPEYSGKMNFYIAAIDEQMRHTDDQPTIGIILCRSKKKTVAEYALRNLSTPIAISTHQLPERLQDSLPTPEQLEMELDSAIRQLQTDATTAPETDGADQHNA